MALDATFHLVNYPPEAGCASVHVATTRGTAHVTVAAGGSVTEAQAAPLSPVYNLNNAASGRSFTVRLGANEGKPETVAVTFVNDSAKGQDSDADVTVIVALAVPPQGNQRKVNETRKVKAGENTFFHIVLNEVR